MGLVGWLVGWLVSSVTGLSTCKNLRLVHMTQILHDNTQNPDVDGKERQGGGPQPGEEGLEGEELEVVGMGEPGGLGGGPESGGGDAEGGVAGECGGRKVEGEKDEVPHKVLACADLVEGDEGERLGEHGAHEVAFCVCEREEDGGEGHLRDERDGRPGEGGVRGPRWGGDKVEQRVVGGEVVPVVEAREVVEVCVLEKGGAVESVHGEVEQGECAERGDRKDKTGICDEAPQVVRDCLVTITVPPFLLLHCCCWCCRCYYYSCYLHPPFLRTSRPPQPPHPPHYGNSINHRVYLPMDR